MTSDARASLLAQRDREWCVALLNTLPLDQVAAVLKIFNEARGPETQAALLPPVGPAHVDKLLAIAGLVNGYHNDGTTLTAAQTLKAIADVLGDPMAPVGQEEPQGWQPIETVPKDGTTILRPHTIWGAMDVRYQQIAVGGKHYNWMNGDYGNTWPDEAFLPFWMPLPAPPLASKASTEGEGGELG